MNMLSEHTSRCIYCNPGKFPNDVADGGTVCVYHLRLIARALELEARARVLLRQAWNVDPERPELAAFMERVQATPDPTLPPLEVDAPEQHDILPRESRRELDEGGR